MAQKRQSAESKLPVLQMPLAEAESQIRERIKTGKQLLDRPIQNQAELKQARQEWRVWSDYNKKLLRRIVDTAELMHEYSRTIWARALGGTPPLSKKIREFHSDVEFDINRLESILCSLELIPEPPAVAQPLKEQPADSSEAGRRVFVVHGHDEAAQQSVARYLEKLELEAVILHEQPDQGRTIIEKFENYAAAASFAVVLLTPDDVGASSGSPNELRSRARQNVILELGVFIAKLGRQRVCVLYKGEMELPSDLAGVLWVRMDPEEGWHLKLGRELKAAGLPVDPSKLL